MKRLKSKLIYEFSLCFSWMEILCRVSIFAVNMDPMKKNLLVYLMLFCFLFLSAIPAMAQCSICTKTAQQLGEGPAKGLNIAILYLAFIPFLIMGYIGYRWWKSNREPE